MGVYTRNVRRLHKPLARYLVFAFIMLGGVLDSKDLHVYDIEFQNLTKKSQWGEAEALMSSAVSEYPQTEWPYSGLVWALREQRKWDDSIRVSRLALSKFPDSQNLKQALAHSLGGKSGHVLETKGDAKQAILFAAEAVQLSNDQFTNTWLGDALREDGRLDESIKVLRTTYKKYPDHQWTKSSLAYSLVLAGKEKEQNPKSGKEAHSLFVEAYQILPTTDYIVYHYAVSLYRNGDQENALRILEGSITKYPNYIHFRPTFFYLTGDYCRDVVRSGKKQKSKDCIDNIKRSLTGNISEDWQGLNTLENIYASLERFDESIPYFESLGSKYKNEPRYDSIVGYHMNRYALRLDSLNKTKDANLYREKANAYLRKAMTSYEASHPNRRVDGEIAFPLKGRWAVISPWDGGGTHSGFEKYCYDFMKIDQQGSLIRKSPASKNSDYYSYDSDLFAVFDGTVVNALDSSEDMTPGKIRFDDPGNSIQIQSNSGNVAHYAHIRQRSLKVKKGDVVKRGDMIGKVGNSGMSHGPHLHFCVVDKDWISLPYAFDPKQVIIVANPVNDGTSVESPRIQNEGYPKGTILMAD